MTISDDVNWVLSSLQYSLLWLTTSSFRFLKLTLSIQKVGANNKQGAPKTLNLNIPSFNYRYGTTIDTSMPVSDPRSTFPNLVRKNNVDNNSHQSEGNILAKAGLDAPVWERSFFKSPLEEMRESCGRFSSSSLVSFNLIVLVQRILSRSFFNRKQHSVVTDDVFHPNSLALNRNA
jgi:hypothetical protein